MTLQQRAIGHADFYDVPAAKIRRELGHRRVTKDESAERPRQVVVGRRAGARLYPALIQHADVAPREEHRIPGVRERYNALTHHDAYGLPRIAVHGEFGPDVADHGTTGVNDEGPEGVMRDAEKSLPNQLRLPPR